MSPKESITEAELLELLELQLNEDVGSLSADILLKDITGWDSMGVLLVMAEFDERLGITLVEETLTDLKSIGDLISVVNDAELLKT